HRHLRVGQGLVGQGDQQTGQGGDRHDVIDRHVSYGALWHGGDLRVLRILYHRQAAVALDAPQPRGAVVESTGEDDAHDARTIGVSRRAEQRVDGRPEAVLPGPPGDADHG